MHGTIMLLMFATPIVFGFANFIMPLQIGYPDASFPRLNASRLSPVCSEPVSPPRPSPSAPGCQPERSTGSALPSTTRHPDERERRAQGQRMPDPLPRLTVVRRMRAALPPGRRGWALPALR